MHRGDVHVGYVDGDLGNVLLRQPPADSLNCLQSAWLVISAALLSDIKSYPEDFVIMQNLIDDSLPVSLLFG